MVDAHFLLMNSEDDELKAEETPEGELDRMRIEISLL